MAINQQELRVRLTAEGLAEVVTAFKQVSSAGRQAANDNTQAFRELNRELAQVGKNMLGGLSIVFAAEKLKELFRQTLESAEGMTRLQRQTGLTTDAIQALGRAASESGSNAEAANAGLQNLTVAIGRAEIGSKKSGDALADLGLRASQLTKLTADQRLNTIAQRLAAIPDPARRARIELALFGSEGQQLDAALVRVGREGFGPFLDRLRELGVYMDSELIRQLSQTKDRLDDLQTQGRGLAQMFLTGLAPALGRAAASFTQATSGGEGLRRIGQAIGAVFNGLVLIVETVGKTIGLIFAAAMNNLKGLAEAAALAVRGHFIDAAKSIGQTFRQEAAIFKEYGADVAQTARDLFTEKNEAEGPGSGGEDGDALPPRQDEALARARYQLITTRLENELRLYEAAQELQLSRERAAYERGEVSLTEYFARRARIINAEYDKRVATARAKLTAEAVLPTPSDISDEAAAEERKARAERVRGEVAELNARRRIDLQQDQNALEQEATKRAEAQVKAEERLLSIAGRRTEAARLRLQLEAQALDKALAAGGVGTSERAAAVGRFTTQGEARIGFDEAAERAKTAMTELETARRAIEDRVQAGQEFSIRGEERIMELERERLPNLLAQAEAMRVLAERSGDPALVAQAEAFSQKLREIATATDVAGKRMREFRSGLEDAVATGFSTFLTDAVMNSRSLGEAFRNAAESIMADLERLAIKAATNQFLQWMFGESFIGSGGKGKVGGFVGSLFGVSKAAGGYVRGPGTTTSDSIPALLSDKEYVVNARATQQPGMLALLEGINGLKLRPRLAAGGLVSPSVSGFTEHATASATMTRPSFELRVSPAALNMTLRDWLERELADQMAKR